MVIWLKTLANHTYSTVGMNQPMNANYKGQKGVFPTKPGGNRGRGGKAGYQGKRRPWESGPRGGGGGGRGGRGSYNNDRR